MECNYFERDRNPSEGASFISSLFFLYVSIIKFIVIFFKLKLYFKIFEIRNLYFIIQEYLF